jgi:hypothetical protein
MPAVALTDASIMPTTRIQAAKQATLEDVGVSTGQKRDVEEVEEEATAVPSSSAKVGDDEPPAKKAKTETVSAGHDSKEKAKPQGEVDYSPKVGSSVSVSWPTTALTHTRYHRARAHLLLLPAQGRARGGARPRRRPALPRPPRPAPSRLRRSGRCEART